MINIRRRIQSLHSGQALIVAAVIGALAGGLLLLRHTVNGERKEREIAVIRMQAEIDSLNTKAQICADITVQLADSIARALNRAMLEGRLPSSGGLIKPIASGCSSIPERTKGLMWLSAETVKVRDEFRIQAIVFAILALISVGAALSILWVWFEGRRAS